MWFVFNEKSVLKFFNRMNDETYYVHFEVKYLPIMDIKTKN
jgi:hypothetical protein